MSFDNNSVVRRSARRFRLGKLIIDSFRTHLKVSHDTARLDGTHGREERMNFPLIAILWQVINYQIGEGIVATAVPVCAGMRCRWSTAAASKTDASERARTRRRHVMMWCAKGVTRRQVIHAGTCWIRWWWKIWVLLVAICIIGLKQWNGIWTLQKRF